jgi:hypothetical protein
MNSNYTISVFTENTQMQSKYSRLSDGERSIEDFLNPICKSSNDILICRMLQTEEICLHAIEYHRARFARAVIKFDGVEENNWSRIFMADAFLSSLICGFVAFRFIMVGGAIQPKVLNIADITYTLEKSKDNIPNVTYKHSFNKDGKNSRVYVYTLGNSGLNVYNSSSRMIGVLYHYKMLLHVRQYNIILHNQMLQSKLCFSEGNSSVSKNTLQHDTSRTIIEEDFSMYCENMHINGGSNEVTSLERKKELLIEKKVENSKMENTDNSYETCIVLPSNTSVLNPTASRTILVVDEGPYRDKFESTIETIFQLPDHSRSSSTENGASRTNNVHKKESVSSNMAFKPSNMKYMNKIENIQKREELKQNMQKMLSVVHTMMHSKLTASKIEQHDQDQNSSSDENQIRKRQKCKSHTKKNTHNSVNVHSLLYEKYTECVIVIPDIDDFDFMLDLYEKSLISYDDFAPYFKTVLGMNLCKHSKPVTEDNSKT